MEVKKPEAAEIAPDWLKPYCKQLLSNLADQGCTSATLRTHERVAADFAVLCSNCHRMIHRFADAGDLAAFRGIQNARVAAFAACTELLAIVADWQNAVVDAVNLGETPAEAIDRIAKSIRTKFFERRLNQVIPHLSNKLVPECAGIEELARNFQAGALDTKEYLRDILDDMLIRPHPEFDALETADFRVNYERRKTIILEGLLVTAEALETALKKAMQRLVEEPLP